MTDQPKTVAEMLDAAQTREEFMAVLNGIFRAAEKLKDDTDE